MRRLFASPVAGRTRRGPRADRTESTPVRTNARGLPQTPTARYKDTLQGGPSRADSPPGPRLLQLKPHHCTCSPTENLLLQTDVTHSISSKNGHASAVFGSSACDFVPQEWHHLFGTSRLCTRGVLRWHELIVYILGVLRSR